MPTWYTKGIARSVIQRTGVDNVDIGGTKVGEDVVAITILRLQAIEEEA